MLDNQLIQVFLPIVTAGLVADGFLNVDVVAANQPTQQGIPTGPTVYFYKIGDKRYGYLDRADTWDGLNMIHTEVQYYETTFQFSSLVIQSPSTPNQYTAADLVNEVAAIMQSDATRQTLYNNNIAILRVQNVSNGYFTDDRDTFEASPIFEFVLVHTQDRVSMGNPVNHTEFGVFRV